MNIGLKIKELVNEKKVTALELSKKLGKSRQTIYNLMEEPHVSTEVVWELSKIFNLPITYFFTDTPEDLPTNERAGEVAIVAGKELAYTDRLRKALARERKKREAERERWEKERASYLLIMAEQAKH